MRLHILAALAAASVIIGCGGSSDPLGTSHANDSLGEGADSGSPVPWQTSTTSTGVGNTFVTAYTGGQGCDNDGTSWSCSYTVQYLSYVDATGYMRSTSGNEPPSISAWVSDVNGFAGTISLYLGARGLGDCTEPEPNLCTTFTSATAFTTSVGGIEGTVNNVYAAFVGPQGQWDSNGGQNYPLGLPTTIGSGPVPSGGADSGGANGSCEQTSDCTGALPRSEIQCADGSFGGASWACTTGTCTIVYCANGGGAANDGGSDAGLAD
jgi:hypothetical protein